MSESKYDLYRFTDKYSSPIIVSEKTEVIYRNTSAAKRKDLSRFSPYSSLLKAERAALDNMRENDVIVVSYPERMKHKRALVLKRNGAYLFAFSEVLRNSGMLVSDAEANEKLRSSYSEIVLTVFDGNKGTDEIFETAVRRMFFDSDNMPLDAFVRIVSNLLRFLCLCDCLRFEGESEGLYCSSSAFGALGVLSDALLSERDSDCTGAVKLRAKEDGIEFFLRGEKISGAALYKAEFAAIKPYRFYPHEARGALFLAVIAELNGRSVAE